MMAPIRSDLATAPVQRSCRSTTSVARALRIGVGRHIRRFVVLAISVVLAWPFTARAEPFELIAQYKALKGASADTVQVPLADGSVVMTGLVDLQFEGIFFR